MADNTFNFDLDAPAVPTLTLDPTPAEEEKAAPAQQEAAAPEQPQVNLTPEEQAMVDQFAEKIDITNSQQVLQYGSACQKKIGDFSEAAEKDRHYQQPAGAAVRLRLSEEDRRFLRGRPFQGGHQGSGRSGRYDHQPDR